MARIELTHELIEAAATKDGQGWTKAQLKVLGVKWPPKHGWKERLVGTWIESEVLVQFVKANAVKKPFMPYSKQMRKRIKRQRRKSLPSMIRVLPYPPI